MSITSQDHIHFSDAGCIGDFVSVYCGLSQGFHISLGSCHIVMDIPETLNKETAGAAERVYQDAIFDTMAICAKVPKMP